ncbi:NIPSNAP family protein [Tateyamaria omphalii]|uniref:NIPSNAP family protein n=1 Tax=Tateyamaria omphalii TaxID=299262 RepID=UPI001C994A41|nr:NIPSNAP family protein [Tateyamaria omphalii]MBY5934706.1 NIPSNAP family protein [Tateyamaria omphalii]
MINQLRIYEVPPGNRGPFLTRFRDHAARLMGTHGFRIQAMWTDERDGRVRFVYLLTWIDEAEMGDKWAAFMADEEWKRIKAETSAQHGDFVLGIEEMVLIPTEFSAAIGGAA